MTFRLYKQNNNIKSMKISKHDYMKTKKKTSKPVDIIIQFCCFQLTCCKLDKL